MEAVRSLRSVGDRLSLVVADGYDVSKVEAMLGVIANPLAAGDSLGSPDENKYFGYDSNKLRVSVNEKVRENRQSKKHLSVSLKETSERAHKFPVISFANN